MNVLRGVALTVGAIVSVTLAGCATTGTTSAPATPSHQAVVPSASASPVDTAAAVREEVLTVYRGMWADYVAAARTADYTSKRLERYAAGDALALLVNGLKVNHDNGTVVEGTPALSPKVVAVSSSKATVIDCADDTDSRSVEKDTGKPANNIGGGRGRHKVTATLTKTGLAWKVTKLRVRGVGSC